MTERDHLPLTLSGHCAVHRTEDKLKKGTIMKTVVGTYDNIRTAYDVANDLINAGYSRSDISVVASDPKNEYATYVDDRFVDPGDDVARSNCLL
jgi:hypothetical protein